MAQVDTFFEPESSTACHIVSCKETKEAAIIDPVLDYNHNSGTTGTVFADRLLAHVAAAGLRVRYLLETHAHADHLSAAPYLKASLGAEPQTCIGAGIKGVQATFEAVYEAGWACEGAEWDCLLRDGECLPLGRLQVQALATPGHTPDHLAYLAGDALFTGDSLFLPDQGTARCDFPGGSASALWASVQRLLALPPATRLFVGHDYSPGGRAPAWQCTVADQAANIHLAAGRQHFLDLRHARDAGLDHPRLLLPALQVNLQAGYFPAPAPGSTTTYLRLPINRIRSPASPGLYTLPAK